MTNTTNIIKVGQMPGRINEFAVAPTATYAEVIALAGLNAEGYEVKADGISISNLELPVGNTQLILLAKQVKGNGVVKVGVMPGRINEYAVEDTATVSQILETAGVSSDGYEVKVDGNTVTDQSTVAGTAGLILLTKQVKGNSTVKIGVMPGRINEFALEPTTTFKDALAVADVNADGYEVKADGNTVTDLNQPIGTTQLILLTKQVKGNIGGFGGGFGFGSGMKSARVADQIDAEAKTGINTLSNAKLVAQQFDFVEQQLAQFAQLVGQNDPMAGMQFQQMQQQINNIQQQLMNAVSQGEQSFRNIDSLTDKIQN